MTFGLALLQIGLATVTFLFALNRNLQGEWKAQIAGVLGLLMIAFIALSFAVFGWKTGVSSVGLVFVYAALSELIAPHLARKMVR